MERFYKVDRLYKEDICNIFNKLNNKFKDKKDELIELDGIIGDGDLGLTMEKGFSKVCSQLDIFIQEDRLGVIMKKLGFVMANAVPSTMGTLVGTVIMKGGDAVKSNNTIEKEDLRKILQGAILGVEGRGKAKRGEKTILDALYPALEFCDSALKDNKEFHEVVKNIYEGSKLGVKETISMESMHGKAAAFGEKSIGNQDPGATVIQYIFETIYEYTIN